MANPPDSHMLRPNELSTPLVPNRLSVFDDQGIGPTIRRDTRREAQPTVIGRRRSGPRISVSAILTAVVFLVIIASRIADIGQQTPGPAATARPGADGGAAKATASEVVFGHGPGADCSVTGRSSLFTVGQEVWWTAAFATARDPGEKIRWQVVRAGAVQVQRVGPTDPPQARWNGLCGNDPLVFDVAGEYRFEVRDLESDSILASGGFTLR